MLNFINDVVLSFLALGVMVNCDKPNIIFILVDDLGYADVGFTRDINDDISSSDVLYNTPIIDKLSRENGIILERHYVHPVCSPTRAAFLTGKYPSTTGFFNVNQPFDTRALSDNQVLFPSILSQYANYSTVFAGKWHVGSRDWNKLAIQFFDQATYSSNGYISYYTHEFCISPNAFDGQPGFTEISDELEAEIRSLYPDPYGLCLYDLWNGIDSTVEDLETYDDDVYIEDIFYDQIASFITNFVDSYASSSDDDSSSSSSSHDSSYRSRSHDSSSDDSRDRFDDDDDDRRFFAYWAPYSPHWPIEEPPNNTTVNYSECVNISNDGRFLQCKMVQYLDSLVGNLVELLVSLDIWDDTLIVFTNDNGGALSNDPDDITAFEGNGFSLNLPLRGAKGSKFEGGIRGASFITGGYIPDYKKGTTYSNLMGIEDWFRIFTNLAGIDDDLLETIITFDDFVSVNQWSNIISDTSNNTDSSSSRSSSSSNSRNRRDSSDNWESRDSIDISNISNSSYDISDDDTDSIRTEWITLGRRGLNTLTYTIIRNDGWKLVVNGVGGGSGLFYSNFDGSEADVDFEYDEYASTMLFNIFTDPLESDNLVDEYPTIAQELEDTIQTEIDRLSALDTSNPRNLGGVFAAGETGTIYPFQSRSRYVNFNETEEEIWSLFLY